MARIRVISPCVASTYDSKGTGERTIEFTDPDTGKGGLISFMREEDGTLRVQPYRLDEGVVARGPRGEILMRGTGQ